MASVPGEANESEYEIVYENPYTRGILLRALGRALFRTFGIIVYTPLFVALAVILGMIPVAYLLGWQNGPKTIRPLSQASPGELAAMGWMCLVGLAVILLSVIRAIRVWGVFLRIAAARSHMLAGLPPSSVEGLPTFSGGRKHFRYQGVSLPPDTLEIGDRTFSLDLCGSPRTLLDLQERNFIGVERLPVRTQGFKLLTPMRVWYAAPTGVPVRVELQAPSRQKVAHRAAALKRKLDRWYQANEAKLSQTDRTKTERIRNELDALQVELSSGGAHASAEDRLAKLEEWLGWLGV